MTETRCEFSHAFGSSVRELDATVVVVESVMVVEMNRKIIEMMIS